MDTDTVSVFVEKPKYPSVVWNDSCWDGPFIKLRNINKIKKLYNETPSKQEQFILGDMKISHKKGEGERERERLNPIE